MTWLLPIRSNRNNCLVRENPPNLNCTGLGFALGEPARFLVFHPEQRICRVTSAEQVNKPLVCYMALFTDNPFPSLILSYNQAADDRDQYDISDWKKELRWRFLNVLNGEGKSTLIDIGAGTGIHAKFFQDQGINVTCVDLSPALIEKCIKKGLKSHTINVLDIVSINQKFDCAFVLNSLLHVPKTLLPDALSNISNILEPRGLMFWGQYGGEYREGIYQDDNYEPKRFFSLLDDKRMHEFASKNFSVEDFNQVKLDNMSPLYFQSMLLRVKTKS